jgi:catechol 2,3-dioxygenase-like lactoylglutathione lyase family enzyme
VLAVDNDAPARPRSLSHVVYFVPDAAKAEAFYVKRLGFICTDRFIGVGPFLRPAGTPDHHTLFMIQTPPQMKGCEHFTFHMGGPTEVMLAGSRFVAKGYESFWGPGRHKFGSNWFWYFNSPLGCHVEYDADMDLHDGDWTAREARWAPTRPSCSCSSTATSGRRAVRLPVRSASPWTTEARGCLVRLCDASTSRKEARAASIRRAPAATRCSWCAATALHAYRNVCPHWANTSMAWRKDAFLNATAAHRLRRPRGAVRHRQRRLHAGALHRRVAHAAAPHRIGRRVAATWTRRNWRQAHEHPDHRRRLFRHVGGDRAAPRRPRGGDRRNRSRLAVLRRRHQPGRRDAARLPHARHPRRIPAQGAGDGVEIQHAHGQNRHAADAAHRRARRARRRRHHAPVLAKILGDATRASGAQCTWVAPSLRSRRTPKAWRSHSPTAAAAATTW